MPKCSTAALVAALEQLSEHSAIRNDRSNWMSVFLAAKRMELMDYGLTTPGADRGVHDLYLLVPGHRNGRINPFIRQTSSNKWLKVDHSGRSTVWNNGTKGAQTVLFKEGHFEHGLRDDALDIMLQNLGTDEPLAARDALAVLLTRDHEWEAEPSRAELHKEAADFVDLTVAEFERITEDRELGVPVLGDDEWSPASIEAFGLGPPPLAQPAPPAAIPVIAMTADEVSADPAAASAAVAELIAATEPAPEVAVKDLATLFTEFLGTYGIAIESSDEVLDLLASTLSSQLVLMVGPSGSGKSLMAAALSAFFARANRRCKIEAARLLAKREELLGYFSFLADEKFIAYDPVLELLRVTTTADTCSPCVTIEEANLSPIEGYLSPLVHGLGGLTSETLTVPLHSQPTSVSSQAGEDIPAHLQLGPYPRFFATINVDAESPAPARKVVSRSCVVLFEAPTFDTALASADSLVKPDVEEADGPARAALGKPTAAFERYSQSGSDVYQQALKARADTLRQAINDAITHRQVTKALLYIAWYVELAGVEEDDEVVVRTATDNAVLHFVLPVLPPHHFARALSALQGANPLGVLKDRIERLNIAMQGQHFGPPPDFWGALS